MTEQLISALLEYGSLGIVVAACFWYINTKDMRHESERAEWRTVLKEQENKGRELLDKQQDELLAILKETNTSTGEQTKLITEMKTILNTLLQKALERRERYPDRGRDES